MSIHIDPLLVDTIKSVGWEKMKNLFSVLFGVFLVVNIAGCFSSSPRDEYVDELEDKYKELIAILENPSSEIIRAMLDIDIESWLEKIKEKAKSYQGNT